MVKRYSDEILKNIREIAEEYMLEYQTNFPSATQVSKILNLDRHTVSRVLKEMGYTIVKANHGKRNGTKRGKENHLFGKKQSSETQDKKRLKLTGKKRPKEVFEKIIEMRKQRGNLIPSFINVRYYEDLNMNLRSSWEADYIRYLNYENITWEYEKYSFNISDETGNLSATYTPDLYLPAKNTFIEIKGYFSELNKEKMNTFLTQYPDLKITFIFRKDYEKLCKRYSEIIPYWGNKGVSTKESMNPSAKLTVKQVKEIKKMISEHMRNVDISKKFNVSEGTISAIKNKRIWSYVNVEEEVE